VQTKNQVHEISSEVHNKERIFNALPGSASDIAERLGLKRNTVSQWLNVMKRDGDVFISKSLVIDAYREKYWDKGVGRTVKMPAIGANERSKTYRLKCKNMVKSEHLNALFGR